MQVRHMLHFFETWERGGGGFYRECSGLEIAVEKDSSVLNEPVYLYFHGNRIVFTNMDGDTQGMEGSSFTVLLDPPELVK
jgi:hypothetical protein